MSVDVVMPQMGESIFEGTITKWLKKAGDRIQRDEPLFEISTDKVDAEIPAPSAGILKEIKVGEGKTVPVQTVVAVIEEAGAAAAVTSPAAATTIPAVNPAPAKPSATPPAPAAAKPAPAATATPVRAATPAAPAPPVISSSDEEAEDAVSETGDGHKIHSSPLVRRMAKEHSIDLSAVTGTGAGGRISKKDILAAIQSAAARPATPAPQNAAPPVGTSPVPPPVPGAGGAQFHATLENAVPRERIYFGNYAPQPMTTMRQRIAEHMVVSKHVSPHVYSIEEADMTRIAKIRERSKAEFQSKSGTKLSFMPFFIRACVEGLRTFPVVNASVDGNTVRDASRDQHRHRHGA